MARQVLAKLVAPRADRIVRRPRVLSAIERGLRSGACWINAPAGYGKTMALSDYLQTRRSPYVWYRVDEGDQDVASFFHYLAMSAPRAGRGLRLPVFGLEYGDQPLAFARRFFRAFLTKLDAGTVLVFDDLHRAEAPLFHTILGILLTELPDSVRCAFVSRSPPPHNLTEHTLKGQLAVVDESVLRFSDREARALIRSRVKRPAAALSIGAAGGWATGLVLMAEYAAQAAARSELAARGAKAGRPAVFAMLAHVIIDSLRGDERDLLLKLSLLPEVRPQIAEALGGESTARSLLGALQRRQLLVTRGDSADVVFHLHDLLREYLRNRLAAEQDAESLSILKQQVARLLRDAGDLNAATELALDARAWPVARQLILAQAEALIAQGRRATLVDRCAQLPADHVDGWLCYWLGVATAPDDAIAERWFARAWAQFTEASDRRGLCLTAAHAVLAKADSWRTHEGLAAWTARAIGLLDQDVDGLSDADQLLVWTGMLRAVDFADTSAVDSSFVERLTRRLTLRLSSRDARDSATSRLLASEALMEHAGVIGQQDLFERAVDSVALDLRDHTASRWAFGMWLVAFGAISARYFAYARRGFPYASPEEALREAIATGERELLRGVEFGALYHLQLQMKSRNDFTEFAALIKRLAAIADSRYTTQVAVVADCQAALHTYRANFRRAHGACERFMAAIDAANEPPLERWPHYITKFQVLLAEGRAGEAAEFLSDLLPLFSGALRQRTEACVLVARACEAKWQHDGAYPRHLKASLEAVQEASWPAILLNVPHLLAELCADALDRDIETEFCRSLIARRALTPPSTRPSTWPWAFKVWMLGEFRLEVDGAPVVLGPRPPARSLDILRVLGAAKDHTCSVAQIYDWLWPDADGDQAKAACEQALHRLRRLLGKTDVILQREGKLRLAADKVWVDLDHWGQRLEGALRSDDERSIANGVMENLVAEFPGPLLHNELVAPWFAPAAERIRSLLIDVVLRLGRRLEQRGDVQKACTAYRRALDAYPTSERCCEAIVRARLSTGDIAGALEEYYRFEQLLATTSGARPSAPLRALVAGVVSSATA